MYGNSVSIQEIGVDLSQDGGKLSCRGRSAAVRNWKRHELHTLGRAQGALGTKFEFTNFRGLEQ